MAEKIKGIPAILEKFGSRKGDKSLLLYFATNELSDSEKLFIISQNEKYVNLVIMPGEQKEISIEELADALPDPARLEKKGKSDSEILRNVLFKLHILKGGKKEDFESYRHEIMVGIINVYGEKCKKLE